MAKWYWFCSFDIGHGKDRAVCFAMSRKMFDSEAEASRAGKRHSYVMKDRFPSETHRTHVSKINRKGSKIILDFHG